MTKKTTIWIDLENTPHVPFFLPIIRELERHGCAVILTSRDFAQTIDLAKRAGLNTTVIGKGGGNGAVKKALAVIFRALKLARFMRGRHISLAVGHGSRGLLLAAKVLRIPSLTLYDYEGASVRLFNRLSTYVMTPEIIPEADLARLGLDRKKHLTYPGLKEEVYLQEFHVSTTLPVRLNLRPSDINVVVRPPSDTAHYRAEASQRLFGEIMTLLASRKDVHVILLPRDQTQRKEMSARYAKAVNVTIPDKAVDGASLLYYSDLVVGGGGTMNREAAVLGVPVYSIFKGAEGAVDRWLKSNGRMMDLESAQELEPHLVHRDRAAKTLNSTVRDVIVAAILRLSTHK